MLIAQSKLESVEYLRGVCDFRLLPNLVVKRSWEGYFWFTWIVNSLLACVRSLSTYLRSAFSCLGESEELCYLCDFFGSHLAVKRTNKHHNKFPLFHCSYVYIWWNGLGIQPLFIAQPGPTVWIGMNIRLDVPATFAIKIIMARGFEFQSTVYLKNVWDAVFTRCHFLCGLAIASQRLVVHKGVSSQGYNYRWI